MEIPGYETTPIHKTNILPLRWTANFMNVYVAGPFLTRAIRASDKARYFDRELSLYGKFLWQMWMILNWPYNKWGTTYKLDWHE